MVSLYMIKGFEWDKWNIDKSYQKHGTTPNESEEVFLDEYLQVAKDIKHTQQEKRFIGLGKTLENKILFVVFILRKDKIRVISARKANKRERKKYEQKAKAHS